MRLYSPVVLSRKNVKASNFERLVIRLVSNLGVLNAGRAVIKDRLLHRSGSRPHGIRRASESLRS